MNRIDRLFGILTFLQSRRYVQAADIANRFEISIRTVYRDIRALEEQGIPLSYEKGRGYFVLKGFFLPPVSFSSEEANALLLMERMVYGLADASIQQHYANALTKVKSVLHSTQKEKLDKLDKQIHLQLPANIKNDFKHLSIIQNAVTAGHILNMEYKNMKEEITVRETEPVGLVFYAFNWHLIAWCHLRNAYRDFRVSRISKLQDTGKPFKKPNHISLQDYIKDLPVDY
jgi:predicted DNA-binding transcriptional regulator YafY